MIFGEKQSSMLDEKKHICQMKFQEISLVLIMSIKTFGVLFVACLLILTAVAEILLQTS